MLLFNSHLKLFPSKLKSWWSGPFIVRKVTPFSTIDLVGQDDWNIMLVVKKEVKSTLLIDS